MLDYLDLAFEQFSASDGVCDVDYFWDEFKRIVSYCLECYMPLKVKPTKRYITWVSSKIIQLKREIKRKRQRRSENEDEFSELSCLLKEKLVIAKNHYFFDTLPNLIKYAQKRFGVT